MDAKKNGGTNTIITHMHPELYASMKLNWYYCCIPVLNETDPLSYMIFAKQIGDAIATFGIDSLNVKKLKYKFAKVTGNDFDTWFISDEELQQKQQDMAAQGGDPSQPGGGIPPKVNMATAHGAMPGANPSIANIAKGARPQVGAIIK